MCRQCIHDPHASGTWREQVGICRCTDCALWRFRPLPGNAPPWIASREPDNLPDGFASLDHDAAIRRLRENIAAKVNRCTVHAIRDMHRDGGASHGGADAHQQDERDGAMRGEHG